jgi:hypothetical protein
MITARPRVAALVALAVPCVLLAAIASAEPRPPTPTREAVVQAFGVVAADVARCGGGRGGSVQAAVDFASDGRVTAASVIGRFGDGSAVEGSAAEPCVLAAIRRIVLPPFERETFRINFPFRL